MATLEVYWSFRSPYSILAADRLLEIKRDYDVTLAFRLVRPIMLREKGFLEQKRDQFVPYFMRDVFREAARLEIPMQWPQPDPVVMAPDARKAADDQPHMDRLLALGVAANEAGGGLEFACAAGKRIWTGAVNWHESDVLSEAAQDAGLTLADLESWARENADRVAEVIEENEAEQLKHHWGVPLMVLDNEPFFGQDRLDTLTWRLDERGLKRV